MPFPFINPEDVATNLRLINQESSDETDVRLQVRPNGSWEVHFGDPGYDTDHRGYWGSGSVPGRRRRFNSTEEAKRLISEAEDDYYQQENYQRGSRRSSTTTRCREPRTGQFAACEDRGKRLGFARPERTRTRGRNRNEGAIKRNREGLTWVEWLRAAGVSEDNLSFENMPDDRLRMLRAAWESGEDPSEYRAALSRASRRARRTDADDRERASARQRKNRQGGGGSCGCS